MKHILFYTDTPIYGGAEKQMELLTKYLKPLGYKVSLACGRYSKLAKMKPLFLKVFEDVYLLPTIHKHDPRHFIGLKKLLKSRRFDIFHIHLWNPGSCRYGFFAAKSAHVPVVTTEHDPFVLTGWKKGVKKLCLERTNRIIAISMDNYCQIAQYGEDVKKRLHLVHNGIESDRFLDNSDKVSLPVEDGDVVITCVAELHPRKGHKYLIGAFEELRGEFLNLHLVLVGDGSLREKFKNISDHVHFLGWRDDVAGILKVSDIFVLPSLKEAFGLSVLEAMASGVAVVATDSGGLKDIIEHKKNGWLVSPANSEALAEGIRALLDNTDLKKSIEKNAIERVKQYFSAEIMARKTVEVYDEALS